MQKVKPENGFCYFNDFLTFQFLQAFKEEKLAFFVVFAKKYNNLSLADTKNEKKLEKMM